MDEKMNMKYDNKESFDLPEGAVIVKENSSIRIKEIENGYLLIKNYDIEYEIDGNVNYTYFDKTWYTKDNPVNIDSKIQDNLSLADKID